MGNTEIKETKGSTSTSETFTNDELKKKLTKEQYHVTQEKGTERAFSGAYWNTKEEGSYHCVVCDEKLFDSSTKFDSGTGWPSFYDAIKGKVEEEVDKSLWMTRIEVHCFRCKAHIGHLFRDGPLPTGLRYCANSASLLFIKK